MSVNPNEQDELEAPEAEEEFEVIGEDDLVGDDEDEDVEEEDVEEDAAVSEADDDEDGSTSLDELLAQRAAARRGGEDADDDDDALLALASDVDEPVAEAINTRVIPMKDRQEFVCNRCHLVKAKSQLADPQRGLCRDCV
jgi:hypothetical protein